MTFLNSNPNRHQSLTEYHNNLRKHVEREIKNTSVQLGVKQYSSKENDEYSVVVAEGMIETEGNILSGSYYDPYNKKFFGIYKIIDYTNYTRSRLPYTVEVNNKKRNKDLFVFLFFGNDDTLYAKTFESKKKAITFLNKLISYAPLTPECITYQFSDR